MTSEARNFGGSLRHIGDELDEEQRRRRENRRMVIRITTMLFQLFGFYYVFLSFMVNAPIYIFKSIFKVAHNWSFEIRSDDAQNPSGKSRQGRGPQT